MTGREKLAELERLLRPLDWQTRSDGTRAIAIAGYRGHVKAVGDVLTVTLRPAAVLRALKLALLEAGLLAVASGALIMLRQPDETELPSLRELLGLHWVRTP